MPPRIECIDCGFSCRVRDRLAGRVVECPRCKAGIRVPEAIAPGPPRPIAADLAPRPPDRRDEHSEAIPTALIDDEADGDDAPAARSRGGGDARRG